MKRRTMCLRLVLLAGGAILLAVGCGDQRVATKENLEHALNRNYSASEDCLFSKPLPFPYEVSVNDKLLSTTRERLDAMVNAGLLSREQSVRGRDLVNLYRVTSTGSRVEGNGRFCYGRREVTSVEKFTPPISYQGMPLTKVEYHFVLKDSPTWVKQTEVRNAFPDVAKSFAQQPVDEATLILTNDGWALTY